jgi:hypothetical protein
MTYLESKIKLEDKGLEKTCTGYATNKTCEIFVRCRESTATLFPCGLPDIDGDGRYSIRQKDNVMKICAFLANTELCTEAICLTCATYQAQQWARYEANQDNQTGGIS